VVAADGVSFVGNVVWVGGRPWKSRARRQSKDAALPKSRTMIQ